ncbi:MAG: MoaD/ThiS family protein [Phyllobacteriaceae bacterium]|nr:MoaD/ThiS family protein [Phyllobacteriaceae bacterium]
MAKVFFTANLQRHVDCPMAEADGATMRDVLEAVFAENPRLKGYVVDDQGAIRKHMGVIVDGVVLADRVRQADRVQPHSQIHVMQALSGG